jgi:hypothetical protein
VGSSEAQLERAASRLQQKKNGAISQTDSWWSITVVILRAGGVHPRSTTSPKGDRLFVLVFSRASTMHPSLQ